MTRGFGGDGEFGLVSYQTGYPLRIDSIWISHNKDIDWETGKLYDSGRGEGQAVGFGGLHAVIDILYWYLISIILVILYDKTTFGKSVIGKKIN